MHNVKVQSMEDRELILSVHMYADIELTVRKNGSPSCYFHFQRGCALEEHAKSRYSKGSKDFSFFVPEFFEKGGTPRLKFPILGTLHGKISFKKKHFVETHNNGTGLLSLSYNNLR